MVTTEETTDTTRAEPTKTERAATAPAPAERTVADVLRPMIEALTVGPLPIRLEFWDGSGLGREDGAGTLRMNTPDALRRVAWSPDELGFGRAFVAGEIDFEGNVADILINLQRTSRAGGRVAVSGVPAIMSAARQLGLLSGRPPSPPPEEANPRGLRHSISRDKEAISHHYDVGNDFYALVLGPSMTYSCARFEAEDATLEQAQDAKHEMICRKLGLTEPGFRAACPGERPRLLDVGCGWGSMAIHAATHHDVDVVGITISDEQATEARRRVEAAGLSERVGIRTQDYRNVADGPYDVVSSVGMAEHVGKKNLPVYFSGLHDVLRPGGRLLNHAIGSVGGSKPGRRQFVHRYVFPDGELIDVGHAALKMQQAGFEVRDVENLREHYARTLTHWVTNLEARWDDAVEMAGEGRARVWQLYMSGSINGFRDGGIQIYQTLGVRKFADGTSGMALTRDVWT